MTAAPVPASPRAAFVSAALPWVLLALAWIAIYLPALGAIEFKGEEARRAMPGLEMLENDDWIVPRIAGQPYYRKPPLVNWLAAGGAHITGRPDEWGVRLPSALAVLALVLAAFGWARGPLGSGGAFCAALFLLTNIGLMERGRQIEIEAAYVALSGLALLWWLCGWWADGPSRGAWARWIGAGLFLGIGMLMKGPVHLLFFYAVVGAVLLFAGELREFGRVAHFAGLILMLGIFAAWAVPMLQRAAGEGVAGVWTEQFTQRLTGEGMGFRFGVWLRNLTFQGWINFLPWVVLLPLAWRPAGARDLDPRRHALWRGLRWGSAISYFAIMLTPGASPRYVLPLVVPAALLLGLFVRDGWERVPAMAQSAWRGTVRGLEIVAVLGGIGALGFFIFRTSTLKLSPNLRDGTWVGSLLLGVCALLLFEIFRRGLRAGGPSDWALRSAGAMGWIALTYAAVVPPQLAAHERHRPLAARLELALPRTEKMYAFDPDSQPVFFYLRRKPIFVARAADLPASARYVFIPEEFVPRLGEGGTWQVKREVLRYADRGARALLLIEIERTIAATPAPTPPAADRAGK